MQFPVLIGFILNIFFCSETGNWEKASAMKTELLSRIEFLGEKLPPNTLDQLIDELGGTENVAEVIRLQLNSKVYEI